MCEAQGFIYNFICKEKVLFNYSFIPTWFSRFYFCWEVDFYAFGEWISSSVTFFDSIYKRQLGMDLWILTCESEILYNVNIYTKNLTTREW